MNWFELQSAPYANQAICNPNWMMRYKTWLQMFTSRASFLWSSKLNTTHLLVNSFYQAAHVRGCRNGQTLDLVQTCHTCQPSFTYNDVSALVVQEKCETTSCFSPVERKVIDSGVEWAKMWAVSKLPKLLTVREAKTAAKSKQWKCTFWT